MNKYGYTSIEVLLSFMIVTFSMLLMVRCLPLMKNFMQSTTWMQQIIGIEQLRDILYLSDDFYVYSDQIECRYLGEDILIEFDGSRIVKREGYQILCTDIKEGAFYEKNNCIYLEMEFQHEKVSFELKC